MSRKHMVPERWGGSPRDLRLLSDPGCCTPRAAGTGSISRTPWLLGAHRAQSAVGSTVSAKRCIQVLTPDTWEVGLVWK